MHQELLNAVKERLTLGYDHDAIRDELRAAGHSEEAIAEVLRQAQAELHPSVSEIPSASPEAAPAGGSTAMSASTDTEALVGYGALLSRSWTLFTQQIALFTKAIFAAVLLYSALIVIIIAFAFESVSSFGSAFDLAGIGGTEMAAYAIGFILVFIAFIVSFRILGFSVLRNLVTRERAPESFTSSVRWTAVHIVPVLALWVMVYAATNIGYTLLILPGVALSIYLMFASLPLARGEERYLAAMVRSTELVYGRWWGVFGRMLVAGLVALLLLIGGAIAAGILGMIATAVAGDFLGAIFIPLLFVLVIGYMVGYTSCVSVTLFESLEASQAPDVLSEKGKQNLRIFYIIAIVLGILATIFLQGSNALLESLNSSQRDAEAAILQLTMATARTQAEIYANRPANTGSYRGVCAEIEPAVAMEAKYSDCIDAADTWALSATTDAGAQWCVDSESTVVPGSISLATGLCQNTEALGTELDATDAKERANELRTGGDGAAPVTPEPLLP